MPKPQQLSERIAALRAEIDALIDAYVEETAKGAPGVPKGVIRQCTTGGETCQCQAFETLSGKGLL
jgi:hypothetical protein